MPKIPEKYPCLVGNKLKTEVEYKGTSSNGKFHWFCESELVS